METGTQRHEPCARRAASGGSRHMYARALASGGTPRSCNIKREMPGRRNKEQHERASCGSHTSQRGERDTRGKKKCLSRALILMRTLVASFFRVQCWRHEGTDAYARVLFPAYVVRYVDALGSSRLLFLICLFVFCFTIRISRVFFFHRSIFAFIVADGKRTALGLQLHRGPRSA